MAPPPSGYDTMTRYQVYRKEIENEILASGAGIPEDPESMLEDGKACNYTAGDPNDPAGGGFSDPALDPLDIDRRLIYLAMVNCIDEGPLHGASSNKPNGLPILAVAEIFLTEPARVAGEKDGGVDEGSKGGADVHNIWGEIAGILDSDSLAMKDIVQLYR